MSESRREDQHVASLENVQQPIIVYRLSDTNSKATLKFHLRARIRANMANTYKPTATMKVHFLSLPPELRNRVYGYVLAKVDDITWCLQARGNDRPSMRRARKVKLLPVPNSQKKKARKLSLFVTCTKIYREAIGMVYSKVSLLVEPLSPYMDSAQTRTHLQELLGTLAARISPEGLSRIETVAFSSIWDLGRFALLLQSDPLLDHLKRPIQRMTVGNMLAGVTEITFVVSSYDEGDLCLKPHPWWLSASPALSSAS